MQTQTVLALRLGDVAGITGPFCLVALQDESWQKANDTLTLPPLASLGQDGQHY